MVWPYFGNIQVELQIIDNDMCRNMEAMGLEIKGNFLVRNLDEKGKYNMSNEVGLNQMLINGISALEEVTFKIIFDLIKTPPREKRILLDQFHSLKYPENGYILRDSLMNSDYAYEWNGDHIFTNYV